MKKYILTLLAAIIILSVAESRAAGPAPAPNTPVVTGAVKHHKHHHRHHRRWRHRHHWRHHRGQR